MKKILSIFLAVVMLLSLASPAFACVCTATEDPEPINPQVTEHPENCTTYPLVLIRGMDLSGLYIDKDTENERAAFNFEVGELLEALGKGIVAGFMEKDIDAFFQVVIDYAAELVDGLKMNKDGSSAYNISVDEYPESAENYPEIWQDYDQKSERGMVLAHVENTYKNHTYLFTYDWRLDPYETADRIAETVDRAIRESGHDKVNIACASMGGILTVAYLSKYGYSKVNRCLFMSSTFCGTQVVSDLLRGKAEITGDQMYNYFSGLIADNTDSNPVLALMMKGLYKVGAFKLLEKITDYVVINYKDEIYERVLLPNFAYMPILWGLVQAEDYDEAVDFVFGDKVDENAEILARGEKLQKMMANRTELLQNMLDDGVGLAIIAHYDRPMMPLYESADFTGDGVLETRQMSGYATVAKYGETLGDDYVPANEKYLSPDRCVDLSTALFPEYTYIIKGAPHVSGNYGTDYSRFFLWLLSYDGDEFYAGVSDEYPQFMLSGYDQHLSKWS
ncbi:MAG: esterase/lipase family protein [Acutalibacteraceae bacterium]